MGRNNADFHGVTFHYSKSAINDGHFVFAKEPHEGNTVGYMNWSTEGGKINDIHVDPDWRRKGIATGMFNFAQNLAASSPTILRPKHSRQRTESGDAWAKTVGGYIPSSEPIPDSEEQHGS
jgi:GNAT superfamily N-acetyltransferase